MLFYLRREDVSLEVVVGGCYLLVVCCPTLGQCLPKVPPGKSQLSLAVPLHAHQQHLRPKGYALSSRPTNQLLLTTLPALLLAITIATGTNSPAMINGPSSLNNCRLQLRFDVFNKETVRCIRKVHLTGTRYFETKVF